MPQPPPPLPPEGEPVVPCMIIEGVFAYVIQLLLAVVAIAALVIKRYWSTTTRIDTYPFLRIRPPSRPLNIWLLDVLKQCTGHAMSHIFNIILAVLLARLADLMSTLEIDPDVVNMRHIDSRYVVPVYNHPDQCAWYFINFVIDSLLGVPIVWANLQLVEYFARKWRYRPLSESGSYLSFGGCELYRIWALQTSVFLLCLAVAKLALAVLILPLTQPLSMFGIWLFRPVHQYPRLELILVMVLAPCLLNVVIFCVYDNILMAKPEKKKRKVYGGGGGGGSSGSSSHNRRSGSNHRGSGHTRNQHGDVVADGDAR